ncbi:MAG: hypothetical protein L0Z53_06770 [Acidobacteriales bacterium]|nr:hypothetical protein [Terriglobales bacterium]
MKPILRESRFDFRRGRNSSISADLLNDDELVDLTNGRLTEKYGAFTKRGGTQRVHPDSFSAPIRGVTQWDAPSGRQLVVISNGKLYWRNGTDFATAFQQATTTSVARTTANLSDGGARGWTDPDGTDDGINTLTVAINAASSTVASGSRLVNRIGDPTVDANVNAADDLYTLSFKVTADGTGLSGTYAAVTADVQVEWAVNGGAFTALAQVYRVSAGIGMLNASTFAPTVLVPGGTTRVDIRLQLTVYCVGVGSGNGVGKVQCFNTVYKTDNFAITWHTGSAPLSLTDPASFAPFRASSAGAPLVLYIASGGHMFSWDGASTLTQLDPTNAAPTATALISYHTRMFAMSASPSAPGLLPKTIFWSKIGDATNFTATGLKSDGGAAVTDFLTGQQLVALEVIGSSLLMGTSDSLMRFQGHSSDDIVIQQDTEGVSAEVGPIGLQTLKRFENAAAFLTVRGPYVATELSAVPIGEQVLPDFDALDAASLSNAVLQYHRGAKELLFAVPRTSDGTLNKTIYAYSTRLQAWYGPWVYAFGINCMSHFVEASGAENVVAGCSDGYVRLMDVGMLDDVLYNGTGGSPITMTVELPPLQFGQVGLTKALSGMSLQATLPSGSALKIKHAFDGTSFSEDSVLSGGSGELNYRVDLTNQGKRARLQFVDASSVAPIVHGFVLHAWAMNRP